MTTTTYLRLIGVVIVTLGLVYQTGGWHALWRGLKTTPVADASHIPNRRPSSRHCEQRIRLASCASVADLPAILPSASGSMCRDVPQGQVTRTRKSPKHSSSRLMWGSTRTGG